MAQIEIGKALLDDVREFIDQKWMHSECELCDTDRWMIFPEPTTHVYLPIGDESAPPRAYYAQPMGAFIPVSCVNCGNLRLIDARIFEKWRREKGEAEK
jgi:hypothetical protein